MGHDFSSEWPIYLQLIELFQQKIVVGDYSPGSKLASVRDMANELGVNPNTMQRALSELEKTELVHSVRTTGRFITEDQLLIADVRRELALKKLTSFLETMRGIGFERSEVVDLIRGNTEADK